MTNILSDTLERILSSAINFAPRLLGAIFIFLIGFILAKLISSFLKKILSKSGIDRIGDKISDMDLVKSTKLSIKPSGFISKLTYYVVLLLFSIVAADVLAIEQVTQLLSDMIQLVPHLLVALIVLVLGLLLGETVKKVVHTTCKSVGIPAAGIIAEFAFFFVIVNALLIALKKASVPTDFLTDNLSIVLAGVVFAFSIGYGLASKTMMANFLASFYSKNKVKIGDQINIDGVSGIVVQIDNSSIVVDDNTQIIHFPLSKLSEGKFEIKKK